MPHGGFLSQHIAIVSTSYPSEAGDAAGHFVETEARQLAALGHRVTVITAGKQMRASHPAAGLEVVSLADGGATGWPGLSTRLRKNPWRALGLGVWSLRARWTLERRGPFDRVIGHWLVPAGFPILTTSRLPNAELEIVVHGSDARLIARWPRPLRRRFFEMLSKKRVALRCVSHELSRLIEQAADGAFRGPVRVESPRLEVGHVKGKLEARIALGILVGQRVVVIAGRLISQKRVACALRAASLVSNLEVLVIGDGDEAQKLRDGFPKVRFLGRLSRPETLACIAAADVVLSASRLEGAPSVVREARALGVPVVACSAGDLSLWAATDPGLWTVP